MATETKDLAALNEEVKGLREKSKEVDALLDVSKKLAENIKKHEAEIKAVGEMSAESKIHYDKLEKQYEQIQADLKGLGEDVGRKYNEETKVIKEQMDAMELKLRRRGLLTTSGEVKRFRDHAMESKEFVEYIESGMIQSGKGIKGLPSVEVKSFYRKSSVTGGTEAVDVLGTARPQQIYAEPRYRRIHVRDLMTSIATDAGAVHTLTETAVAGDGPAVVGEGLDKPEVTMAFDDDLEKMKVIAAYMTVTVQQMLYIPQLMDHIEMRMAQLIPQEEDEQILKGDNIGVNYNGILNREGIREYDPDLVGTAEDDTPIDVIRRGMAQQEVFEHVVTGITLHPIDWMKMEIQKGSDKHYIWAMVQTLAGPMLWQVPVAKTTAMTQGQFLLGDWQMGARIWDRQQATIRFFEQDGTNVKKNLVTVRGEQFSLLEVMLPGAFLRGNLNGGS